MIISVLSESTLEPKRQETKCLKIQNESTVLDNNIFNIEAASKLGASSVDVTENKNKAMISFFLISCIHSQTGLGPTTGQTHVTFTQLL